jgi:hypothetical protein
MPSGLVNVYGGGRRSGQRNYAEASAFFPRGGHFHRTGRCADGRAAQLAGNRYQAADCFAVVASSSNAVEISRMLMTPIRL